MTTAHVDFKMFDFLLGLLNKMHILDREKLMLALRGHYILENKKTACVQGGGVSYAYFERMSLCVKGMQPLPIPIPKQV